MSPQRTIPDLLDPVPTTRIDAETTKVAIGFAFASGVSGGLFSEAAERATLPRSTWQPGFFASDLFLTAFVSQCFRVRIGQHEYPISTASLVKLLAHPPADPPVVEYRRAIVRELAESPPLRRGLERLYLLLCRLRTHLEGATTGRRWDSIRRQLDILKTVKDLVDCMTDGFRTSSSGLARLAAFGDAVRGGEPFRSLSDLLAFDENLATLNVKVGFGADGTIRGFQIVSVQGNEDNPFVSSALRRWLAKLELFVRGFQFGDREVMARLVDAVFDGIHDDVVPFVQLLGDVEFYLGALGFLDIARASGLEVCLPELVDAGTPRALRSLFNPLLLSLGAKVVPCDVEVDRHTATILVTGPNSGGKTRLLQALGLAQLLGQSGLFVPARSGTLALCPGLVMSLIQEVTPDQVEGRLGTELVRIRTLFEQLPPGAMVVLDELCSGTNPSEGEEIFELVVRMLTRLEPQAFITTHFLAFAERLKNEGKISDLRFLQVELGSDHQPTYQFVPGVARTSLAAHAAARLGVTGDQLLSLVERNIANARTATRRT